MSTNNDGWILMSERKPTVAELPVWGWMRKAAAPHLFLTMPINYWTHWKPAAIPAPPMEKTQEEKDEQALRQWCAEHNFNPLFTERKYWHAALAYERAEVGKMLPEPNAFHHVNAVNESIQAIRARCGGGK